MDLLFTLTLCTVVFLKKIVKLQKFLKWGVQRNISNCTKHFSRNFQLRHQGGILSIFPGFGVSQKAPTGHWSKSRSQTSCYCVFRRKKNWEWGQNKETKENTRKKIEPSLKKRHATFREKCIRTGSEDPSYYQKWGRYQPAQKQRLNIDQIPLPFVVHGKKTYEYIPKGEGSRHNTWISQPGLGLEKRQCSLRLCSGQKRSNQS